MIVYDVINRKHILKAVYELSLLPETESLINYISSLSAEDRLVLKIVMAIGREIFYNTQQEYYSKNPSPLTIYEDEKSTQFTGDSHNDAEYLASKIHLTEYIKCGTTILNCDIS
ncbi:MAG: hypothetical protein BEN18_01935 [Epulopiscium sp. Nuni2H_MBin001]|nr:MAG: hypothetical protein BEN18_01935 [Epulopiscium sp. Nuni2H_MBin001]